MNDEIPLTGGRITQDVVRKGNYVLRPCCSNSAFVHDVLKWLESKNVYASPRFIGIADDGREITTFLEGIVPENLGTYKGNPYWQPSENQLYEAGNIIKILHTALFDFPGCLDGQTVCHNDLSPCNFMFKNDLPYAVFDWDGAKISDPLDDVAYAIWMWCDIGNEENSPTIINNNINIILDAYELDKGKRNSLIIKVHEQMNRVANSSYSANRIDCYQWAKNCDLWLNKYQNQIMQHFML